jgi:hypothetical protein
VVAKVKERLAVNKQGSHKFHIERFSVKKLNEVWDKQKYPVKISNGCAALEDKINELARNSKNKNMRMLILQIK